jgi:hypothetical protein
VPDDACVLPTVGEPHYGMLVNVRERLGPDQLRSGIESFGRRIREHEQWIAHPLSKAGVERHVAQDVERWRIQKWPADIERLKAQQAVYQAVLEDEERGTGSGGP